MLIKNIGYLVVLFHVCEIGVPFSTPLACLIYLNESYRLKCFQSSFLSHFVFSFAKWDWEFMLNVKRSKSEEGYFRGMFHYSSSTIAIGPKWGQGAGTKWSMVLWLRFDVHFLLPACTPWSKSKARGARTRSSGVERSWIVYTVPWEMKTTRVELNSP